MREDILLTPSGLFIIITDVQNILAYLLNVKLLNI